MPEANNLAKFQVAEYLDKSSYAITSHYNGTSEKQKRYYGIQVTCEKHGNTGRSSDVLGLRDTIESR